MAPGATEMRDLPGVGRRLTPVSSAKISQKLNASNSPQIAPNQLPSPHHHHLASYPPAYNFAPALASPSSNYPIFLEEENRQLKMKIAVLNKNARKVEFLEKSLDHVQNEFARLSELCTKKSQIDEKRISTLENALKQMTLNYQNSQQQLKEHAAANYNSPEKNNSDDDLRASPKLRAFAASQTDLDEHSRAAEPSSKGEMQNALSSFNFLLRALSEKDDEISSLKKKMQNAHPFCGSDRSLDGLATTTFAPQNRRNQPTYNVEYLLYGNSNEQTECNQPPKVLTPPYEFEPATTHSKLQNSQLKAQMQIGLDSI